MRRFLPYRPATHQRRGPFSRLIKHLLATIAIILATCLYGAKISDAVELQIFAVVAGRPTSAAQRLADVLALGVQPSDELRLHSVVWYAADTKPLGFTTPDEKRVIANWAAHPETSIDPAR